jgi:hypothetical protein
MVQYFSKQRRLKNMTDSEKLELLSIHAEIQKLQRDLNRIEERAKKVLGGIPDQPKVQEQPTAQTPRLGTSIYDSVGTVPNVSAAEVRAHTMEFNERITK